MRFGWETLVRSSPWSTPLLSGSPGQAPPRRRHPWPRRTSRLAERPGAAGILAAGARRLRQRSARLRLELHGRSTRGSRDRDACGQHLPLPRWKAARTLVLSRERRRLGQDFRRVLVSCVRSRHHGDGATICVSETGMSKVNSTAAHGTPTARVRGPTKRRRRGHVPSPCGNQPVRKSTLIGNSERER